MDRRADRCRAYRQGGREDCFRRDPRLGATDASGPVDYNEPIYDQGHLAAFANQSSSDVAGHNSFIMSNMAPQTCQFNRGIWQILEGIARLWATEHGTIYVLSGSVFDRDGNNVRDADAAAQHMVSRNGKQRVAIPSAFYKIMTVRRPERQPSTLSIMMPHDTANPNGPAALQYLRDHITTVAAIEAGDRARSLPDRLEPRRIDDASGRSSGASRARSAVSDAGTRSVSDQTGRAGSRIRTVSDLASRDRCADQAQPPDGGDSS